MSETQDAPDPIAELANSYNNYREVQWLKTGVHAIDLAIGSGIPRGRFIEVVGEPSTFKSAFGYKTLSAFQQAGGIAVLLDTEAKTDRNFVAVAGVNWKHLIYHTPDSVEDVNTRIIEIRQKIREISKDAPICILWDSLAGTPSVMELEDENLRSSEMAVRARLISSSLRKNIIENTRQDVTLIALNHLKSKIGVMFGAKTDSPGGKAVKFHCSVRLHFKSKLPIKKGDTVVGMEGKVKVVKNNVGPPGKEVELRFDFKTGFDPYGGLADLLLEAGRFELAKPGWYKYGDLKFRKQDVDKIVKKREDELLAPL